VAAVGSYAYNATMTLGASALARPLRTTRPSQLHGPLVVMLVALAAVLALARPQRSLRRRAGIALLASYPVAVIALVLA
jgi:cation:H+ antiporter